MLRVASEAGALAREDLAFALSVVLLGMLMMVVRRNAVSMVVGFMSLENGLILAATGAKGMPLVVEVSVAFSVLVALVVIGAWLLAPAATEEPPARQSETAVPPKTDFETWAPKTAENARQNVSIVRLTNSAPASLGKEARIRPEGRQIRM